VSRAGTGPIQTAESVLCPLEFERTLTPPVLVIGHRAPPSPSDPRKALVVTAPVTLTVRYTLPGAPECDTVLVQLRVELGAQVDLRLAVVPEMPAPRQRPPAVPPVYPARLSPTPQASDAHPAVPTGRLSAAQARERMQHGWTNEWSVRKTALHATRSASRVRRVFRQLEDEQSVTASHRRPDEG
jgi:hypothetical protein